MGQAANALGRVSKNLQDVPADGVKHGTKVIRDATMKSLRGDAGGDRRLSGLRGAGSPLSVKVTTRTMGNLVEGHVMAGPPKQRAQWFWMDEGTRAGRRRRRRRDAGSATFFHPGTPAKRTWSEPVKRVVPSVERHFEELHERAMKG